MVHTHTNTHIAHTILNIEIEKKERANIHIQLKYKTYKLTDWLDLTWHSTTAKERKKKKSVLISFSQFDCNFFFWFHLGDDIYHFVVVVCLDEATNVYRYAQLTFSHKDYNDGGWYISFDDFLI